MKPPFKKRLLQKTLAQLGESLVVVEGDKDEKALRNVGVRARVVKVRGLSVEKVVEKIVEESNGKRVVLLVDFDREGKRKEKELKQALAELGFSAGDSVRKNFRELFRINTVEQLPYALQRIEKEIGFE